VSFVPKTDNVTLWALLGALVAALSGLEWWSRRERSRAEAERGTPGSLEPPADPAPPADAGWPHGPE
jgi:hypothetical protein